VSHDAVIQRQSPATGFGYEGAACVDVHCHCLPHLDDGPGSVADALALAHALLQDGISTVIATPHQLGRYVGRNSAAQVRNAVRVYQQALAQAGLPLTVLPGADVRCDEGIIRKLKADSILSLADRGKHILLELPHEVYFEPWGLLADLQAQGIQPILSHPERHYHLQQHPSAIGAWLEHGAVLQVTAGSLLGDFGEIAQRFAWQLLEQGFVSVLATDAHHHLSRPPRMTAALRQVGQRLGAAAAGFLGLENPQRIVDGQPLSVPYMPLPVARRIPLPR
jgi:protein-tyrosine phosphatase